MTDTLELESKALDFKITDDVKGDVQAVIATFDVIDKVDDVTRKGFFGEQDVSILVAHNSSELAVGKGQIFEDGNEGRFRGRFNLSTQAGAEAFKSVAFMGGLQQWSYGYRVKQDGFSFGEQEGRSVRFLHAAADGGPGADVFEVSPLVLGAGQNTRTLEIKSSSDTRFVDQVKDAIAAVNSTRARAEQIAAARAEKGRTFGTESKVALQELVAALGDLQELVPAVVAEPPANPDDASVALVRQAAETAIAGAEALLT